MEKPAAVKPSVPARPSEARRLDAVRRYDILDTPPDGAFDRIAALAARFFDVPIATVTIVDEDRIWFKAAHGIDVEEVGRDPGLCASAILQDDPYIVTDAIADPRCLNNPLVHGELGVRFYAAAPIRTHDGYNLGTVNVIAGQPRAITPDQTATLQDLAEIAAGELEVRLTARRTVESDRQQRRRAEQLIDMLQRRLLPQEMPRIPGLEVATYYQPVNTDLEIGGDFFDVFALTPGRWAVAIGDVCGKGPRAAAATGEIRYTLRAVARMATEPAETLTRLNEVLCREEMDAPGDETLAERFCTASFFCLDQSTSPLTLTVANAGHPLALIRRAQGSIDTAGEPGQLLGAFQDFKIDEHATALHPGDMLLIYTDGAIEQHGLSIEVGERALVQDLQAAPDISAEAALAHIREAVEQRNETRNDDIALMLIRVLPI